MFAHRAGLFKGRSIARLLTPVFALLLLGGCGGGERDATGNAATAAADPADLEVIEGWVGALSEGDVEAAADYFAIPSTAENGPVLTKIESLDDAIGFNRSLPCGAEVISARTQGDLTTATFGLTERPGGACGPGVGGTASTSFEIEDGKIVEWRRIDDGPPAGGGTGGGAEV
jgi:limonene-1,2-epoxide hydrolase